MYSSMCHVRLNYIATSILDFDVEIPYAHRDLRSRSRLKVLMHLPSQVGTGLTYGLSVLFTVGLCSTLYL